jgi:uncharacterized damage-inducible protein DinB
MLDLLTELFRYQAWADAQVLAAVKAHPPAVEDEQVRTLLHHIVAAQRYFLGKGRDEGPPPAFAEIEALFVETARLGPTADIPSNHLLQTVLHSQHHRGQIAMRLRALGGAPPTVDYILWKRKQA